jgi:hypothetical protein
LHTKNISKFAYKLALTRFWCESNNEKIPTFWIHDIILWSLCEKNSKPKNPWMGLLSMEDKKTHLHENNISPFMKVNELILIFTYIVHKNLTHTFGNIAGCQTSPFVFLFVQWLYLVCHYSPEKKADPGTQVSLEILK